MNMRTGRSDATPQISLSVVIPAYNAARYLRETLDSVVSQSGLDFEVHVVDDGSNDGTAEIAGSFGPRVVCRRIANTGGPSRPRNIGLHDSVGEYVAFFDADDVMRPGKLRAAVNALSANDRVGLLFTDFSGIDESGSCFLDSWLAEYTSFREDLRPCGQNNLSLLPAECAYSRLLCANFVGTSSVVCRREALTQAGGFDETLRNAEDGDLWMRLALNGWDFLFLDDVCHDYRKASGSIMSRGRDLYPDMIRGMEKQLHLATKSEDLRRVKANLGQLWLEYAYNLRRGREFTAARAAYTMSLKFTRTPSALLGLARSVIRS